MKTNKDNPPSASKKTLKKSTASVILCLISAVFVTLTVLGLWLFRDYITDPALLRDKIGNHYVIGAIFMVLISAVQVIVALLPGEFVEIAAGYVFGSWMGSLLCLLGIVLGSCTTILLVRRFGRRFVYAFYPKEKIDNLPILKNPAKRNLLTFLIFLIPGTPKDLFTYAIGLTDMSIPLYIALTTASRFPSVILSTLSGDAAGTKDYKQAIIFIALSAVVSGIGLLIYNRFSKKHAESAPPSDGNGREAE
jgi:uncharacterized membrane protein YdjX (TVP38/TMEM64 family)